MKGKSFGADLPDNLSFLYLYGEKKPFMLHTKDWLEKIKASACCDIKGLAGSGHWLMRDQTEQVGDLILAWVE